MTIEFNIPSKKISTKLIEEIRDTLIEFSHINKHISRAEVSLKQDDTIITRENIFCQIRLTIYGGDVVVHTRTYSFEKSVKEALKQLKRLIKQQEIKQKEPPEKVTSTVKV